MNKKIIFLACAIGIIALLSLNYISAGDVDTSDWVNITVNDINFQIPPEYGGEEDTSGGYVFKNVFTFGLVNMDDDKYLRNNYGYESTNEENYDAEEMEIDGHHAVAFYSNRSIVNHTVTYLFFESNKTFYALSYDGDSVNSTMKKIVSYSPKSKLTKEEFDEKLNKAQEEYIEDQIEQEEAYEYEQAYRDGYNQGRRDSRGSGYLGYYFFYKLGQRNR